MSCPLSDEQLDRQIASVERLFAGEITAEQHAREVADIFYGDDEEGKKRFLGVLVELSASGLPAALETAARLPGVEIPVGPPKGDEN